MRDLRRDGKGLRLAESRRRFLQGATAVAAASAAALAGGPDAPIDPSAAAAQRPSPVPGGGRDAVSDTPCCNDESAVPLIAAALFDGRYIGLTPSPSGAALFELTIDKQQRVSLGAPLAVDLPEGFVSASLSVARDRLVLAGGVPFVWDSYEVDDEMSDEVRAVMDVVPDGMPTSGRRRIDVMGVQPVVWLVDPPSATALPLPAMPKRAFAIAAGIAETASGGLAVLVEHSDNLHESYYAAAIDVLEQSIGGGWAIRTSVRELGESGPNFVAADEDDVVVGVNTPQGAMLVSPARARAGVAQPQPIAARVLALLPGRGEMALLTSDRAATTRLSVGAADGSWRDGGALGIDGEAIVGAVAVAGVRGQTILLGRRSARLVEDVSILAARVEGGERHVL